MNRRFHFTTITTSILSIALVLGLFVLSGCLTHAAEPATHPPVPIRFHLDEPRTVTLVIEDAEGQRVRNLISAQSFPAGDQTVWWDGMREDGVEEIHVSGIARFNRQRYAVAQPGSYRVRGLSRGPLDLKFEFTPYTAGSPPWKTEDGSGGWLHDHSPPSDILWVPEKKQFFVVSFVGEIGHGAVWLDETGRKVAGTRGFGAAGGWCGAQFLARDSKARAGVWAHSAVAFGKLCELWEHGAGARRVWRQEFEDKDDERIGGLAVHDGVAVLGFPKTNRLLFVSCAKGETLGETTLDAPRGMAMDARGRLLMISGRALLRYPSVAAARAGEKPETVIAAERLDDPQRITVHPDGSLLVSDWGGSHQVKIFSEAGEFQSAIGKAGKPQAGRYDPLHLHHPNGCCIAPDGSLWIAEADMAPKRLSAWSADGKLLRAFYGPSGYGGGGTIDASDPSRFFYAFSGHLDARCVMEFTLDWKTGGWQLKNVLSRQDEHGGLSLPGAPELPLPRDGRTYLVDCFNSNPIGGRPVVSMGLIREDRLIPVAVVGHAKPLMSNWSPLKALDLKTKFGGKDESAFLLSWSEGNGNGAVDADEVQVIERAGADGLLTMLPDFRILSSAGWEIAPPQFGKDGVPRYDLTQMKRHFEGRLSGPPLLAADGTWVVSGGPFTGYREGKVRWSYPNEWPSLHASQNFSPKPRHTGDVIGPCRVLGYPVKASDARIGELWAIYGNFGNIFLMTTDGLFVAELFHDRRVLGLGSGPDYTLGPRDGSRGVSLAHLSLTEETFWTTWTQTPDQKVYLVAGHGHSTITRLDGLETLQPFPAQTIEFTAELAQASQNYASEQEKLRQAKSRDEGLTILMRRGRNVPVVDGLDGDWIKAPWVTIEGKTEAAMQIGNDKLFVAVRSSDPGHERLTRNVADSKTLLFKGGGAIDLQIGTAATAAADRTKPVLGDLRLLVTQHQGKPTATLYRPVSDNTQHRETFTSPVQTVAIDEILDASPDLELKEAHTAGHSFYEFSIPLKLLRLQPDVTKALRGDIGVIIGNGIETTARAYWHNKRMTIVTDIPTEASLYPQHWGALRFEKAE